MDAKLTEADLDRIQVASPPESACAIKQLRAERNEARTAYAKLLLADIAKMEEITADLRRRIMEAASGST